MPPNSPARIYRFTVSSLQANDPRSASLQADSHLLGITSVENLACSDLYFIEGQVSQPDLRRLAIELLSDPIMQSVSWAELSQPASDAPANAR